MKVVYPDHAPAFQGGGESTHEKPLEKKIPNASMMQPGPTGNTPYTVGGPQGNIPYPVGGGFQGHPLVPGENQGKILPVEENTPRFPLGGRDGQCRVALIPSTFTMIQGPHCLT